MPAPTRPLVWLAGDTNDACLAPAAIWLRGVADTQVVDADRAPIAAGRMPAAIVVFQSRAGQVSAEGIARLEELAPFAHVVWLLGPWCEGQRRLEIGGDEAARIYWHEWSTRLPHELGLTKFSVQRTPLTGTVAIATGSREAYLSLADACAAAGVKANWNCGYGDADFRLLDGWPAWTVALPSPPPAVLLLDWPRPEDLDRAARLGISRVLAKPLRVADLLFTLKSLAGEADQFARRAA